MSFDSIHVPGGKADVGGIRGVLLLSSTVICQIQIVPRNRAGNDDVDYEVLSQLLIVCSSGHVA